MEGYVEVDAGGATSGIAEMLRDESRQVRFLHARQDSKVTTTTARIKQLQHVLCTTPETKQRQVSWDDTLPTERKNREEKAQRSTPYRAEPHVTCLGIVEASFVLGSLKLVQHCRAKRPRERVGVE